MLKYKRRMNRAERPRIETNPSPFQTRRGRNVKRNRLEALDFKPMRVSMNTFEPKKSPHEFFRKCGCTSLSKNKGKMLEPLGYLD